MTPAECKTCNDKCKTCNGTKQLGPPLVQGWLPCWMCARTDFYRHQIIKTLSAYQGKPLDDISAITDDIIKAITY